MQHAPFVTRELLETPDLDVAMTRFSEGRAVRYTGPAQGVFRFESMKVAALRAALVAPGETTAEQAALRRFFAAH